MTDILIQLTISYAQLAVFDGTLTDPFNDWQAEHVAQGFAWRPGSVSFRMLEESGEACVTVARSQDAHLVREDALRVITVPFLVPGHGAVEIASIGDGTQLELAAGEYQLVFEHGYDANNRMWCNLTFVPVSAPVEAKIVRADAGLDPPARLLMDARPA